MTHIIGNLKPEDDYTHELGPEQNFNESVYFNFFDPSQNRGGFVRIGNRANEGYAEMTVIIWNADGTAYFTYAKPSIEDNNGWDAGGLKIDIIKPAEQVNTRYEGSALYMQDPSCMSNPSRAFKENPKEQILIDLTHDAVGPLYGHVGEAGDGNNFARSHSEQHMRVTGSIKLGSGDAIAFNGHGLRDHSWGPRYWQATPSYRWITGNFGDDLGMIIQANNKGEGGGIFHEGDKLVRFKITSFETEYEPGTHYHTGLTAELALEDGRKRSLRGKVMGYIPLRNRRKGANTHVGEGMTAYSLNGTGLDDTRTGYGLSEYLDQSED